MRSGLWFGSFVVISALAHFWVLQGVDVGWKSTPPRAEVLTSVEIVEELPPTPLDTPPIPPPPEEAPPPEPPPPKEEILAASSSEMPSIPEATPTPRPTPAPTPTPKPQASPPKPASPKPATAKAASRSIPDRSVPVVQRNSPPRYPEFARRKGWEGRVVVRVVVDPSGRPRSAKVQAGSGFGVLDQAALQTVKSWQFHPRVMGGSAVEGTVDVPVNFSLRGR